MEATSKKIKSKCEVKFKKFKKSAQLNQLSSGEHWEALALGRGARSAQKL